MPDKSKRRNKNKNKRKNKTNRPENSKTNSDGFIKDNETSSSQLDVDENIIVSQEICDCASATKPSLIEIPNLDNIQSNSTGILRNDNEDFNNNSSVNTGHTTNVCMQSPNVREETNCSLPQSVIDVEHVSNEVQDTESYIVESPEQSLKTKSNKTKLKNNIKSKSLDNDDVPKIVEITDDVIFQSEDQNSLAVIDTSNVLVSDVESDVEWENACELQDVEGAQLNEVATGTVSITAVPLNVAQCQQTKPLTPELELSLRNYLKTLDLSTHPENVDSVEIKAEIEQIINREIKHRLRKKALGDDFEIQKIGAPRMLDVIAEEGSSESSIASRRQSYLSDRKSDVEDLDDDVFEDNSKSRALSQKVASSFPKKTFGRLVPQQCVLVGAKIKDPELSEARGDWTMTMVEKMTGAEVVYLTDSSGSTSSLHEYEDDMDDGVETDVSVRMITPTIEVTDTESLLRKTFIPESNDSDFNQNTDKNAIADTSCDDLGNVKNEEPIQNNQTDNPHEIIVLSTDNLKTDLYVKEISSSETVADLSQTEPTLININEKTPPDSGQKQNHDYDIEMKVLKCELNDAINNLIKEVSDSELNESSGSVFVREDSSSSVCSSQCTAKYNPTHSSLNDVFNIVHDEVSETVKSSAEMSGVDTATTHVKEVIERVTGTTSGIKSNIQPNIQPLLLRDICVKRIAKFPFGDKILEELASVSKRIQKIASYGLITTDIPDVSTTCKDELTCNSNMPYYTLPELSSINRVILPSKTKDSVPPPVKPRRSSLRKSREEDASTSVPPTNEPVYVCLSPSQKMLMEKTNTVAIKEEANELGATHKNVICRRDSNGNHKKENQTDNVGEEFKPIAPFKSQTGSRLLALIRDPKLTTSINSINKHCNSETLENKFTASHFESDSNIFKPIPPPRPKKMSAFYESDDSSDFTDTSFRSLKSGRKFFHYSTGNLSKEIEEDVSSIQHMHRNYTNMRDEVDKNRPRRPSLPKDLCDQQMEYIRQKEKEVEAEIRRLEAQNNKISTSTETKSPRAPMIIEKETFTENYKKSNNFFISKQRDFIASSHISGKQEMPEKGKLSKVFSRSQEELLREKMYSEYVNQMAEREERKQHKVIKITNTSVIPTTKVFKSMPALDVLDSKVNNRIEKEFICKARERWDKLGIKDPETEDERDSNRGDVYREPKVIEHKIKVIEGNEEKEMGNLPRHLQEFIRFTAKETEKRADSSETVMIAPTFKARSTSPAVWRAGAPTPSPAPGDRSPGAPPLPPPPPVWTPGSAGSSPHAPRKPYRPVHFEDTPPTHTKFANAEQNGCTSGSESETRLRTSQSAPVTGLNTLGGSTVTSRLPRAQNPTVTLLQKAREGQISRGSNYLQQEKDSARLPRDRPSPPKGDPVHALRREYASETEASRSDNEQRTGARKMADAQKKVEGIGPITKDGMPVSLRSEVKDPSRWYKKMYDTIHKNKYDDDFVTIRYKSRRGQPPERISSSKSQYAYFDPRSGYLSEPEGGLGRLGSSTWSDAYDSDVTTGPRRRTASVQEERRMNEPYTPSNKYSTLASARASHEMYKSNQPGRIENYIPGRSSVVDKEAKQWWDEVMDIFDGQNISSTTSLPQASPKEKKDITSAILSKSNMARALKESGYESDSTLVFRRREETDGPLSPAERHRAYRDLQAGGEPPLRGFRSPAPPRQDETEIEYIPISPTLTKIRVHKKTPQLHEVICYPVTSIETDADVKFRKLVPSFINPGSEKFIENPPAPPRRISSKNSKTLQLVTSTRPVSTSPKRNQPKSSISHSNVDFLKEKISYKLHRQNTHIISKSNTAADGQKAKNRIMSTSAPPALNRRNISVSSQKISPKSVQSDSKSTGFTSSFGSSRRTLLPTEYANSSFKKYGENQSSVVIEGGAGRKTPISNILDKMTSLDKLWSAEKRNERIDLTKAKSISKSAHNIAAKANAPKSSLESNSKSPTPSATHRSRDMIRTAEKMQKLKVSSLHTKSNPCIAAKIEQKSLKSSFPQSSSNISKSSTNISTQNKKINQIKTATVTNLKKKKSPESVVTRPRSVPCHESCSKKSKEEKLKIAKKSSKVKSSKRISTSKTSNDSESGSQFGDSNTSNFGSFEKLDGKRISTKDIKRSHDAVVSDSFFQHLFLGKSYTASPTVSCTSHDPNKSVLQKAEMFQSLPQETTMPKSFNSYLIHRKPVSLSRFKLWDRYPSPTSVQSPRSISWPGRMHGEVRKFDSLSKWEEFGSTSSLATVRSKSEPPGNKLFFSQTSRPKSPTIIFYKKDKSKESSPARSSVSPSRLYFSQTSRPVSPKVVRKVERPLLHVQKQSLSPPKIIFTETVRPVSPIIEKRQTFQEKSRGPKTDCGKYPSTIFFSQTSRPVSPKVLKKSLSTASLSRSQSTSPVSIRSPSYRRIHNVRLQSSKNDAKSAIRTRSADSSEKIVIHSHIGSQTKSDSSIHFDDPEYDEYIQDMENMKARSERFRELNRYYTYLERVGELERATSTRDLRHRRKDEEIIDFERWKKIRSIERAEQELNTLYKKLKLAQTESDVLFYPRDVKDFRWNYDTDRGLRIKEKSVEDLKDHFQQIPHYDSLEFEQPISKDTYKPLWRGTSVAETAFNINNKKRNKNSVDRSFIKPTTTLQQDATFCDLRKKIGLGSRLWSSLSLEQVHALKNQLNAIYSKELESKSNKDFDKYAIDIKEPNATDKPKLQVRCSSLTNYLPEKESFIKLSKSDSIAAIPCPITSVKDLKNNVNKIQMTLSENEKRKISQTLSKELLDRINKYDNPVQLSLKQELEMGQAKENGIEKLDIPVSVRSIDEQTNFQNVVLDNPSPQSSEKIDFQCQSSASETETASSDHSNKTVVYREPSKEVQMKVKYFESVTNKPEKTKTVHHVKNDSVEMDKNNKLNISASNFTRRRENENYKSQIVQSQSCANLKELFGESEKNKFLSLPSKPELRSTSGSPHSEVNIADRRTPDTLRSSDETIWRSRSPSPDPERYWRAYLNLARAGEVRRLARRFDSPTAAGAVLRRHRSDPEIARNVLNRNWSAYERLLSRRDTSKTSLPVARVPLRTNNRYMPHIDIISKLASLRRRTAPRSRSAEETLQCRSGEVERIRRRFETMSLLGQIYASAPDVSELRDMAPYLAGSWIAHRYPMRSDNNRSIKDPSTLVRGRTSPVRKEVKRPTHNDSVKLSSILKSDVFEKQHFDPSLHRPVKRYEPPRTPPRPPPASWPHRVAPHVTPAPSRHTVTFQETASAPEPPRRTSLGSFSDTESPRRYVESDVNIHYRCPVRHDPLPLVPERELARQQAEHMKRLYREQRRNKYLQELQDMQNRRHQDNFTPAQKNILPLNRYDEADKVIAKALYTFNGQTNRELSFRKGEIIHVRRQIDANWYEGEIHGRVGLFPYNYVEIQKGDIHQPQKKPVSLEGRARAKFDFTAQTNLELPLKKGEVVVLTRRIDQNWWEGRNGNKTGIFPDSYVTILQEPSQNKPEPQLIMNSDKPVASPAAHGLMNGTAKRSMGPHSYTPQQNSPALSNAPPATQPLPGYASKTSQALLTPSERGYGPPTGQGVDLNNSEPLYVDTNAEAIPYRAMYKYRPQNPDELELNEGDTVYVLEKCDDGWYVGSSQRTGRFGTFPGNYVERI